MLKSSDYEFLGQVGKNMGWNTATITGGEPLISPIFQSVTERLNNLGISLTVVTNASLLARPQEVLKNVKQLNVSLHTLKPEIYTKIVQVNYPLKKVLSTIVTTRALLPNLIIHLNYTVIRGLNDSAQDFENLLRFAREVKAEAKFIDLSTTDKNIATDTDEIIGQLQGLGFEIASKDAWQCHLARGNEKVRVTKCPFNGKHNDLPTRDIFVDSDGTFYKSYGGYFGINVLNEIKSRDEQNLVQKMQVLF